MSAAPAPAVVLPVAAGARSSAIPLPFLLWIGFGLALLVVALAATPVSFMPRPLGALVYDRRQTLILGGLTSAAALGLGFVIALSAS